MLVAHRLSISIPYRPMFLLEAVNGLLAKDSARPDVENAQEKQEGYGILQAG